MSTTLVAPTATFASMMEFVAARHVYKEERYPNGDFSTAERRARFVLDHTLLHLEKSLGLIAAEREKYDHDDTFDVDKMHVPTTKLFVNLLTFAGELGMTADVLQSGLDRDYAGYFGPLWLMRRESLTERCSFDGPPEQERAGVIMHRLLVLDLLKGRLAEYRLVEFSEMYVSLRDPCRPARLLGDPRRDIALAMLAHTCSLAYALEMTMDDIATLIPQVMRHG